MNIPEPDFNQCPLRFQAIHRPDCVAMLVDEQPVSFQQLDTLVEACRLYYQQQNINSGDHLAVVTLNPVQTVILALACLRSGWVFCPINPVFPENQRRQYADRVGAALIVDYSGAELSGELSAGEKLQPLAVNPEKTMSLIATSGTSGIPKAVAHCYRNHYASAMGSQSQIPLQAEDRWLMSLPLFHVGGFAIVIRCLLAGAVMVCFRGKRALHSVLEKAPVSHLSLVNTQLFRLLEQGINFAGVGVRYILLGGGIASPTLVEIVRRQKVCLLTTYGMTEMASQVATGAPHFLPEGVTSGEVLPGRELIISDDNEILVRGETLASGYFQQGKLISLTDSNGWYRTGDKGQWHNNQLRVCGRIDNMFISGGENIHPEEVEQALLTLPEIVQAVVIPVPDKEFGERPVAYIQTVDGTLNVADIRKRLAARIARFKIPDYIWLFPAEAANVGIKINRRYFQQLACSPIERCI